MHRYYNPGGIQEAGVFKLANPFGNLAYKRLQPSDGTNIAFPFTFVSQALALHRDSNLGAQLRDKKMATRSQGTVVGVFRDSMQAQQAVNELRRMGFDEAQIGVVGPGNDTGKMVPTDASDESYATEGALSGLATGAGVGALWGLGILAGVLPAIGPAIAGGTLAAILSSTAAGAAAAGLGGALIGLGLSKDEADYYNTEFESGRTVVTVSAGNRRGEAESALRSFGSYDISTKDKQSTGTDASMSGTMARDSMRANAGRDDTLSGASMAGNSVTGGTMGGKASSTNRPTGAQHPDREGHVTAFEEELHVEKKSVDAGSVNVHKEVHTEHKTIDVPVKREEVVIERRTASGQKGEIGSEQQEIRIPVREEQVKVDKQTVAKEDVVVSKRTVNDTEHIDETLRKEEIKVDRDDNVRVDDRRGRKQ